MRSAALASIMILAACTSSGVEDATGPASAEGIPVFVRDCGSAVFGQPNMRNAEAIGPLVLVGVPQAAGLSPRAFRPSHGRYGAIKVLAVVVGSNDVTVTVSEPHRGTVALLYDPTADANRYGFEFAAGHPAVTFSACAGGDAQYNGGFIAKRPTCVTLDVESGVVSMSRSFPLGRGQSCVG